MEKGNKIGLVVTKDLAKREESISDRSGKKMHASVVVKDFSSSENLLFCT
jgi:hypothetical protein